MFLTVANEVFQVYHNLNHRRYNIPDLLASGLAIFNSVSENGQRLVVLHFSLDLTESGSGIPCHSIRGQDFVFFLVTSQVPQASGGNGDT